MALYGLTFDAFDLCNLFSKCYYGEWVVGWYTHCCSFQKDGPVMFPWLAGSNLAHLKQIWVGLGPFSLSNSSISISLPGRGPGHE